MSYHATDVALAERIRTGDQDAVRELVHQTWPALYHIASTKLQFAEDIEEAVQDAYVNALRTIGDFNGTHKLLIWLRGITKRAAIDIYRKLQRRREKPFPIDNEIREYGFDADPRSHDQETLEEILNLLPVEQRTVLQLCYLENRRYREIADELGVSRRNVYQRLIYGLEKLRLELAQRGITPKDLAAKKRKMGIKRVF